MRTPTRRVTIRSKVVQYETGERVVVPGFTVRASPVTVAEYEAYVSATKYITMQERRGESSTFRCNSSLDDLPPDACLVAPAQCLAYQDALAFCEWAGERLPSEAEWLAFAVDDWTVVRARDDAEAIVQTRRYAANAVRMYGMEWTSTPGVVPGRRRVRCRPFYSLFPGWDLTPESNSVEVDESRSYQFFVFRTVTPCDAAVVRR